MAGGKFSKPRPHRDEERQIEEAFRQVTGQAPKIEVTPDNDHLTQIPKSQTYVPQDTIVAEQDLPEQTFQPEFDRQMPKYVPHVPEKTTFELPSDEADIPFEKPQPEVQEQDSPDFIDKLLSFVDQLTAPGKKQTALLLAICGISLIVIVTCIALFFADAADPNDGRILKNVYLADINVGGLTKSEAISALQESTGHTYRSQDMVIDLSGTELRLSPKETGAKLDVKAAVNAAYEYGRSGTQDEKDQALALSEKHPYYIGLLPYLDLDTDYILDTLTAYAQDSGSTLTQPTYGLEGKEPELSAEKFNENAPTQTLVIHMGMPGIGFDVNDVYEQVLDAYSLNTFLVTVENVESVKEPDAVDLEKIYKEFYIAPVDASVNLQTFETIPGRYGYGFDLENARKLLEKAAFGEKIRIPMEYIPPEVLNSDSFYQDVLGSYQTRHTSDENRNINLQLACKALNGTIVDPGATFSFNQTVGQRTSDRGYKAAPSDSSASGDTTLGGGISQVSSTLYYAALLSELDITSRRANTYAPNFIDFGMDAAVSWDLYDFTFHNNLGYPIMIQAEVTGGYVRIKILGTEERSHYVMLDYTVTKTTEPKTETKVFEFNNEEGYKDGDIVQEGITGYTVKTYRIKYNATTNEQLSRDYITTTEYTCVNKTVAKVLPEETTAPTEAPTTTPPTTTAPPATVPPTTVPPTTVPPTTVPPTTKPPVVTEPPIVTEPPVTEPPIVTEPPVTEPPVEEPPVEEPPVEEPPVIEAPAPSESQDDTPPLVETPEPEGNELPPVPVIEEEPPQN